MRRRAPAVDPPGLPAELAAGPDPDLWCPPDLAIPQWVDDPAERNQLREAAACRAWRAAGAAWSTRQGLGLNGWRELLPADVSYAVSALGHHHRRDGGLRAPWER